jgi:nucleotide-binding universal stress UspA family protein
METTTEMGRRILVPWDGSALAAEAIPQARAVAAAGAEVILLWVAPEPEMAAGLLWGSAGVAPDDVLRADEEVARQALESEAERLRAAGGDVKVESVVAIGDPAEEILRTADERAVDLLVLANHGRGAVGRWAFGSVADRVSRSAKVPVMIVRPGGNDGAGRPSEVTRRVMVPLDGSELAARAVPVAASLAKRLDVPVLLVDVIDTTRAVSPLFASGAAYSQGFFDEIQTELRTEAERALAAASESLKESGVEVRSRVLDGSPADALLDLMEPSDVVVLTSHGRSGVRRWLLGSVAEKLVRQGVAPIMLVPAAGAAIRREEASGG